MEIPVLVSELLPTSGQFGSTVTLPGRSDLMPGAPTPTLVAINPAWYGERYFAS
jgi:hypothetical protein